MVSLQLNLWPYLWHPDIYIFQTDLFSLRWYSLLFALGFIIGRFIVVRSYKLEGGYGLTVDLQMFFMVLGTLFGSRMGHVLFYEPKILKRNFLELFYFWESGLASHGAAIGILLGMAFYSYRIEFSGFKIKIVDRLRRGYNYYQVMDRMIIAIAFGCAFIRMGNFINSEIIGKPTNADFGVVFTKPVEDRIKNQLPFVREVNFKKTGSNYETGKPNLQTTIVFENAAYMEERIRNSVEKRFKYILPKFNGEYSHVINPSGPSIDYSFYRSKELFELRFESVGINRHPAQLYEALNYALIGLLMFLIWNKHRRKLRPGSLLGFFFMTAFTGRFLLEFFKENQVNFEKALFLNMGQLLCIPFFFLGIYIFFRNMKSNTPFRL